MSMLTRVRRVPLLLALVFAALAAAPPTSMAAESSVNLGTARTFAVLAGSTVTNTGSSVIAGTAGGEVGVSAGSAITGFTPGTLSGVQH